MELIHFIYKFLDAIYNFINNLPIAQNGKEVTRKIKFNKQKDALQRLLYSPRNKENYIT